MSGNASRKNPLLNAFNVFRETEEFGEALTYIKATNPEVILYIAFSAGWLAHITVSEEILIHEQR